MSTFTKHNPGRTGAWEAAGLEWLAAARDGGGPAALDGDGPGAAQGARVVGVVERTPDTIVLERVQETRPTPEAAEAFGRELAATHAAGAPCFGAGPVNAAGEPWEGTGYQGPNEHLLPLPLGRRESWGEFYANLLEPLIEPAWGGLSGEDQQAVRALLERLRDGELDVPGSQTPARCHGDLWAGNVLWSPEGAVLIDPAAHGGHPETDLAALQLFGIAHQERILGAYQEAAGWDSSWRQRVPLHQLHLLFLHVAVFGGSYVSQAMTAVHRSLAL
ncbi:fructosamine kinase family protein [Corynebacterium urealyticum]|uniref:Fructosamine kinase n=1 Tax=Corynebacterium urealyticum (strain ATCC 43042 / DSM 7109) TaxID=504474 RepID=B1VGE1_CORU7|nr:fructosamine kinase family protein [Corynebacterium urealyticum]QQC41340.1 fructosamine kinase family protein [Corynebacterium urealyticum]CAQ05248.1 hypothetical protein cu1288 [Corynebacterium urealyticum DSM 7109]SNV86888.1 Fructosamine-3-kinase [Corynebacterium urealyticum]